MKYKIEISETANEDLNDLFSWIAFEKDSPKTAFNYLQNIYNGIKSLENNPTKYPIRNTPSIIINYGLNVRRFNYKSHAVLYSIDEIDKSVFIIKVLPQNMITGLN